MPKIVREIFTFDFESCCTEKRISFAQVLCGRFSVWSAAARRTLPYTIRYESFQNPLA